jgi:FkbM family methyltransferase
MLIPAKLLKKYWNVNPTRVLHVGAHEAEEYEQYVANGWGPVTWIEAQPDKVQLLKTRFMHSDNTIIEAAVWDISGVKLNLKIASSSQSSSLLNFGIHKEKYPTINTVKEIPVTTETLDNLLQEQKFDLIALDIQGSELRALEGFRKGLENIKWVYTEVNKESLYEGCCLVEELDDFLGQLGFIRKTTKWTTDSWGDALYIRKSEENNESIKTKILRFFLEILLSCKIQFISYLVKIKKPITLLLISSKK